MEPQPNDIKAIRVLYLALLAGQLLFAILVAVLVETGVLSNGVQSVTSIFQVAVLVIAATTVPASFFLFRKRLSDISSEEPLDKKLEKYRAALILRMALCEMPALFAIIAYFLTHNRSFLWMTILLIINFLFIYPTNSRIIDQLQLGSSEQSSLGLD
jgi:hypothetical protein